MVSSREEDHINIETKKEDKGLKKMKRITPSITIRNKQRRCICMYCLHKIQKKDDCKRIGVQPTKRGSKGECHAATF